jgi:hypothetical protein
MSAQKEKKKPQDKTKQKTQKRKTQNKTKTHLGLLKTRVLARLEVAQVAEHALLELFHIAHGAGDGLLL